MGNSEGGGVPERSKVISLAEERARRAKEARVNEAPSGFERQGKPNATKPQSGEDIVQKTRFLSIALEMAREVGAFIENTPDLGITPDQVERMTHVIVESQNTQLMRDLSFLEQELSRLYQSTGFDLSGLDSEELKYRLAVAQAYLKLK